MKRLLIFLAAVAASGVLFTADAQPSPACRGPRGCGIGPGQHGAWFGPGMGYGPRAERRWKRDFEVGDKETIRGRVVSVERVHPRGRGPGGIKLMVESDSRVIPVHVGPGLPLDQLDKQIEKNDRIEITGVQVERFGDTVLRAGKIKLEGSDKVITRHPPEERRPPMGPPPRMKQMKHRAL